MIILIFDLFRAVVALRLGPTMLLTQNLGYVLISIGGISRRPFVLEEHILLLIDAMALCTISILDGLAVAPLDQGLVEGHFPLALRASLRRAYSLGPLTLRVHSVSWAH